MNGVTHRVGEIIELDYMQQRLTSIKENVEKIDSIIPEPEIPPTPTTPLPKTTMSDYKVVETFETPAVEASEGVEAKEAMTHEVGTTVTLTDEEAAELGEKVEKVAE